MRLAAFSFLLVLALAVAGAAAAADIVPLTPRRAPAPASGIRPFGSRDWVIFDGVNVACLGIDRSGQIPGTAGIACFLDRNRHIRLDSTAGALFGWRPGTASRVDIGSLGSFLTVKAFASMRTRDLHVPLLGAVTIPGTNVVCQSQRGTFLDRGHASVWCFVTSSRRRVTKTGLNGVVYTASRTDVGFDKHPEAARIDGSSGFLIDDHLVGAISVPRKGRSRLLATRAQTK